jgi:hypothetical protein
MSLRLARLQADWNGLSTSWPGIARHLRAFQATCASTCSGRVDRTTAGHDVGFSGHDVAVPSHADPALRSPLDLAQRPFHLLRPIRETGQHDLFGAPGFLSAEVNRLFEVEPSPVGAQAPEAAGAEA